MCCSCVARWHVCVFVCLFVVRMASVRLGDVEARLQQMATVFEQARQMAKKTKAEFERVKKLRYGHAYNPGVLFRLCLTPSDLCADMTALLMHLSMFPQ